MCQCVNKYLQEELKTTANKLLQKRQNQLTVNTIINGRSKNGWMFKVVTATDPIQSIVPYLQYTTYYTGSFDDNICPGLSVKMIHSLVFSRGALSNFGLRYFNPLMSFLFSFQTALYQLLHHLHLLKKDAICDVMVLLSTYTSLIVCYHEKTIFKL